MPTTASRPAVHYRREGQGVPVVLSHALGCNLGMWDDVAPIFNAKCVQCHQQGGIAPFRLDDYEIAKAMR